VGDPFHIRRLLLWKYSIIKQNFTLVILAIIVISLMPAILEFVKHCRKRSEMRTILFLDLSSRTLFLRYWPVFNGRIIMTVLTLGINIFNGI